MGALDAEPIHQLLDVPSHRLLLVARRRPLREAAAAEIRHDDAIAPGELRHGRGEGIAGLGKAVQQDHCLRRPYGGLGARRDVAIEERDPVHRDDACRDGKPSRLRRRLDRYLLGAGPGRHEAQRYQRNSPIHVAAPV